MKLNASCEILFQTMKCECNTVHTSYFVLRLGLYVVASFRTRLKRYLIDLYVGNLFLAEKEHY